MFGLVGISWTSMWSPVTLAAFVALALIYLYITGPGRARFADSTPVPAAKKAWFVGGLAFLYVAFGSPIDLLGHMMFTFHMISMSFAYLVAAPMLLAGTPEWLLRPIGRIPGIKGLKFLVNPIFTLLFFNIAFSIYHVPLVHDFVMLNFAVHTAYYVLLMLAALLMWFPVICPVSSLDKLEGFRKMGYIFANSVLLTPACALIIFSGTAMYVTYTDPMMWATAMGYCVPQGATALLEMFSGPQALGWMDALVDQRTGGVLMKIFQEIVYGSILVYVFRQWYRKENPKAKNDDDSLDPTPAYFEMLRAQSEPAK
ncbi:cytochrome c oxidase assembly factor CtaG [Paenibacillus antri]|uniref:Cytochrome c oxidase assembly factor CtaG n=1 Tax=Paenibacillus antri TaxID=2582848 RepID=A0A5R9GEX9_9BACL|nr:cytochrome c oxidase assembly factor CtaG [Paenibacillus antri]TLS51233.1 cytochrome c oxidase assembly factor CtaG [Paenibacillus antri]